jgi:hypothetical protein
MTASWALAIDFNDFENNNYIDLLTCIVGRGSPFADPTHPVLDPTRRNLQNLDRPDPLSK